MAPSQGWYANLDTVLHILLKDKMVAILIAYRLVRNIKWDMSAIT